MFPFIHEQGIVSNGKIYLSFLDAIKFIELLVKIVPEISIEVDLSTRDLIVVFLSKSDDFVALS